MAEQRYIKAIGLDEQAMPQEEYFTHLPVVRHLAAMQRLPMESPVTFFVGENGAGKSTLLEAIAICCGFNAEGGTVNFNFFTRQSHSGLHNCLQLVRGVHRPKDGFFLRAESFYNVATQVDGLDEETPSGPRLVESYGGVSLHEQSHGESFMSLVQNRFGGRGLYILDEPEAALSPLRQMALIAEIHRLVQQESQFIISTHSPILMAYPNADIYEMSEVGLKKTPYQQTRHYIISHDFLNAPQKMVRYLLEEQNP